jgi:hypothetical protein
MPGSAGVRPEPKAMTYEEAQALKVGAALRLTQEGRVIHPNQRKAGDGGIFCGCINGGLIRVRRNGNIYESTYHPIFWQRTRRT